MNANNPIEPTRQPTRAERLLAAISQNWIAISGIALAMTFYAGILSTNTYYDEFGISIGAYFDLSDYSRILVKKALPFFFAMICIACSSAFIYLAYRREKAFSSYIKNIERYGQLDHPIEKKQEIRDELSKRSRRTYRLRHKFRMQASGLFVAILVGILVFPLIIGSGYAQEEINSTDKLVSVVAASDHMECATLIGGNANFIFLYEPLSQRTTVLPKSDIKKIQSAASCTEKSEPKTTTPAPEA